MRILSLLLCVLALFGCRRETHVWKGVIMGSTENVRPSLAHSSLVSYVLKQTHEPFFRFDGNHQLTSRILKHWERSEDYKTFVLCIDDKAEFEPGLPLNTDDVSRSLAQLQGELSATHDAKNGNCVTAKFNKPQLLFFDSLTDLAMSPTRPTKNPHVDVGLGAFRVESLNEKEIVLTRKLAAAGKRFDRIELTNVQTMKPEDLNDHSIQEFNLITRDKVPDWVRSEYAAYPISHLSLYIVLFNNPDQRIRQALANCLSVPEMRAAFFPSSTNTHDVGSLFPVGVRGAIEGPPHQNCPAEKLSVKKPVKFLNWKPERHAALLEVFKRVSDKTGIPIEVEDVSLTENTHRVLYLHSGFDMTVISMENDHAQYSDFLELLIDPAKKFHSVKLPDLEKRFQQLKATADEHDREALALELNNEVLRRGMALPLMQPIGQMLYPKNLKAVRFGSSFSEYPEIGEIE